MHSQSDNSIGKDTSRSGELNSSCAKGNLSSQAPPNTATMEPLAAIEKTNIVQSTNVPGETPVMGQTTTSQNTDVVQPTTTLGPTHAVQQMISVDRITAVRELRKRAKRTWPPPWPRETVLMQAKWAEVLIDLTDECGDQPPTKVRKTGIQRIDGTRLATPDATIRNLTLQLKQESPATLFQSSLVGYNTSSSGSPEGGNRQNLRGSSHDTKTVHSTATTQSMAESSIDNAAQSPEKSEKQSFVDEGHRSLSVSQQSRRGIPSITEEDLARKLIYSDLRTKADKPDLTLNNVEDTKLSKQREQRERQAATLKERLERESIEKSRALRDTATLAPQNEQVERQIITKSVKPSPKNLSQFTGQDSSSKTSCADSDSSVVSRSSGTEATLFSEKDASEDDLFGNSQESAISTSEIIDLNHDKLSPRTAQYKSTESADRTTSPQFTQLSAPLSPKTRESGSRQEVSGYSNTRKDLEAGHQQLKELEKHHAKHKAGAKTLFTPRHMRNDSLGDPYQSRPPSGSLSTSDQKIYLSFGGDIPERRRCTTNPYQGAEATDKHSDLTSISNGLQRAQNRTGGLAVLAQQGGQFTSSPTNRSARDQGLPPIPARSAPHTTIVTADTFQAHLSRYARQLSQQEKEIITKHEWLKEHQRDLRTLKQAYVETAKFSCEHGITEVMEPDLSTINELMVVVLVNSAHDPAKRSRVQQIKEKMVRRQTRDYALNEITEKLGMVVSRKRMQEIEDALKKVEEDLEAVGQERQAQNIKYHSRIRTKNASQKVEKQVRFESPEAGDPAAPGGAARPARPKVGTDEYRKTQSDKYWKGQEKKEAELRAKLQEYDERIARSGATGNSGESQVVVQPAETREPDAESVISEEDEGFAIYPGTDSVSDQPLNHPVSKARKATLAEIRRPEEERAQSDVHSVSQPVQPAVTRATKSSQAADQALAQENLRRRLGVPPEKPNTEADAESDESDESDSPSDSVKYVWNYSVYGAYMGPEGLALVQNGRLGKFLHEENAAERMQNAVQQFCAAYEKDYEDAVAAEDERRTNQLVDPKDCEIRWNKKRGEQIVDFPAASARIWMEKKMVRARSKVERKVSAPSTTYYVLYERKMADGEVRTPDWADIKPCSCAALANRRAFKVMLEWYGEHMKDGYLALQKDALEQEIERLGEEGRWNMKESFRVKGGEESMRVWVDAKLVAGPHN